MTVQSNVVLYTKFSRPPNNLDDDDSNVLLLLLFCRYRGWCWGVRCCNCKGEEMFSESNPPCRISSLWEANIRRYSNPKQGHKVVEGEVAMIVFAVIVLFGIYLVCQFPNVSRGNW